MAIPTNLPQGSFITGLYHLDEAVGNAIDAGPNGNDLVEIGGTIASVAGKIETARDFETGDTEHFAIADGVQVGLDLTGEFTITFWMKLESIPTNMGLVTKNEDGADQRSLTIEFLGASSNKITITVSPTGLFTGDIATTASTFSAGTFFHIGATHDQTANEIQLFVNGIADGAALAYNNNLFNSSAPFVLGAGQSGTNNFFDGVLDEVIVWKDTFLTPAEMLEVKNITAYKFGKPPGFSGTSIKNWSFSKAWEKHDRIWTPKLALPKTI